MNIYLGCGLTHVPRFLFEDYCNIIHDIAKRITVECGYSVKYALVDSDPQLSSIPYESRATKCFQWDRNMVENADVIIAEVSFPSLGLGIELGLAESKKIPIILCFRDFGINKATEVEYVNPDGNVNTLQIGKGFVSLMALGMSCVTTVIKYDTTDSLVEKLKRNI